jgi:hypothetical protein
LDRPDPVDDRGVVEFVADDRVTLAKEHLEDAAVGVEARGVEDRRLHPEELTEGALEPVVLGLGAADEAHRGHPETPLVERRLGGRDDVRVVGEPQVVVGAEVQGVASRGADVSRLRGRDLALALVEPGLLDLPQGLGELLPHCSVHGIPPSVVTTAVSVCRGRASAPAGGVRGVEGVEHGLGLVLTLGHHGLGQLHRRIALSTASGGDHQGRVVEVGCVVDDAPFVGGQALPLDHRRERRAGLIRGHRAGEEGIRAVEAVQDLLVALGRDPRHRHRRGHRRRPLIGGHRRHTEHRPVIGPFAAGESDLLHLVELRVGATHERGDRRLVEQLAGVDARGHAR